MNRGGVKQGFVVVEQSCDYSVKDGLSKNGEALVVHAGGEEWLGRESVRSVGENFCSNSVVNGREGGQRHDNRSFRPSCAAARA